MEIYELLNKRTLMFKDKNINFISEKMKLGKIEAEKIYNEWKKYYMSTSLDENSHFIRRVRNIETGETFNTPREAGESVGVARPNISCSCCNGKKAGGYHWEYI